MTAPVRVRLPMSPRFPAYCACCLLAQDAPGRPVAGLAVPWCEDCRRHVSLRRVDRGAGWGKLVAWALAVILLLPAAFARGWHAWGFRIGTVTFFFLGVALSALSHLRLEDRKETCASFGVPVRVVERDATGMVLECDNPDFASPLREANGA